MTHNDLTFFDNREVKLADRFKSSLRYVRYFDILVGYFRTSGFYKLYKEFENIEKIRILVGLNADKKTVETVTYAKQLQIDFNHESHSKTKAIISSQIEEEVTQAEDNSEIENGIQKFVEYLKSGKIEIRAYPDHRLHAKVYISTFNEDFIDKGRVITGSSNFSESGLSEQLEFNVELKNYADYKFALDSFNELWAQSVDLTETYIETINNKTWLNPNITPYELYLKFLYENFEHRLSEDKNAEISLPAGFKEYRYQTQAVKDLADIVDKYNGAFIADVVGLGKTYVAAMYMQNLSGKKLIICPPPVIENWKDAINDFGVRSAEVESLGKLEHIKKKGYDKYDYIFVDEAHRFRNEATAQYKLLNEICYGKKVILITATPLNNSIYDFLPLIKLFQDPLDSDIDGVKNLDRFFKSAVSTLKHIDKGTPEYQEEVKRVSKRVRDRVLRHLLIRRTRTDVKEFFPDDIEKQGLKFPNVETPIRLYYKFDEKTNDIFNQTIENIKKLTYARYNPTNSKYLKEDKQVSMFEQTTGTNLVGFMKTMLVKRLASSNYAFKQTINRFIKSYENFIKMYNNGTVYISKKVDVFDYLDDDNEEGLLKALENDTKAKTYYKEDFKPNFIEDLEKDLELLSEIKDLWSEIKTDIKKESFITELKTDKQLSKSKILIFTESTETGADLYKDLYKEYGSAVMFYSSNTDMYNDKGISLAVAKDLIHKNFDPKYNIQEDNIRILITTDVLAEGINLHRSNIIVNYDLPWNPTRVLQRVGRVNRVGTKYDKIYIYNFFPTSVTDIHLGLEDSVKAKIQAFHETLGEDAKYLSDEEQTTNHKLFGDNWFSRVNDKNTYDSDAGEKSLDLQCLQILKDVRENDIELFDKIKKIPKKSRSAKKTDCKTSRVITFYRKNNKHFRTYITDGTISKELTFDEAFDVFKCNKDCPKSQFNLKIFHALKKHNDEAFFASCTIDSINDSTKTTSKNDNYVKGRIKESLKDKSLTNEQEMFFNSVLDLYKRGVILNSKEIKSAIEKTNDNQFIYKVLKEKIPETYFNVRRRKNKQQEVCEVVLSEYLEGING